VRAVESLLALVGQPGLNYSDEVLFSFGVDDYHKSPIDWTDGDETVFEFRMLCVEDLEIVGPRLEEPLSLRKRQPVLTLVTEVFRIVPLELHIGRE
jgi:hypothetical protein